MTIYEALQKDHRKVESLLDRLVTASKAGNDEWKTILDEIRTDLVPHAHAEEAVFYNALRELDESKSLVAHSYGEHAMAETELRTLGAAKMIDANWTALAEKFRKNVLHHIEEEEGELFEAARRVLTAEEARQIGAAFVKLKAQMAGDADSLVASNMDLIINLLPPRFTEAFRKNIDKIRKIAA